MKIKNGSRYPYQCSRYVYQSDEKHLAKTSDVVAMCISQGYFYPFRSRYVYTFIDYQGQSLLINPSNSACGCKSVRAINPLAAFTGNHRPCIDPDTDCLLRTLLADLQSTRDHFDRLERHQVIDNLQDAAGQVVRILERTEAPAHG